MLNGHFIADLIGNGHGERAGLFGNRSSFGCSVGRNRLGENSFRRSGFFAVGGRFGRHIGSAAGKQAYDHHYGQKQR